MSTTDKLTYLVETKNAIKEAIVEKCVTVTDEDSFRSYADKIISISTDSTQGYTPPTDWPVIDSSVPNNQIHMLFADIVCDSGYDDSPALVIETNGTFTANVNWGDGTNTVFTSSAEHVYAHGTGTPCSRGYTTFKVVITVTSGAMEWFSVYMGAVLRCVVGLSTLQTLTSMFSSGRGGGTFLEEVIFNGSLDNVQDMYATFNGCTLLQSVTLQPTTQCTDFSNAFASCRVLKEINNLDTSSAKIMTSMFSGCYIPYLPNLDLANVIDMTTCFSAAYGLTNSLDFRTASKLIRIGCLNTFGLQGLLLPSNAPWTGASPQIDVQNSGLSASAINALFASLGTVTGKTIRISGASGAIGCDKTIATAKGWTVMG